MPYKWEEPEVVLQVDNVTIYHTYKDGQRRMAFWFTEEKADCDEDLNGTWFDVRKLATWERQPDKPGWKEQDPDEDARIRWALFEAIMCGEIGEWSV